MMSLDNFIVKYVNFIECHENSICLKMFDDAQIHDPWALSTEYVIVVQIENFIFCRLTKMFGNYVIIFHLLR